jgi:chromosome segregation ATPase
MHAIVLVSLLLVVVSGCVSEKEYKILLDKYAHTLAVKNEIDQEYGALRKELVALEQGHGRLAAALADQQQADAAIHQQLASDMTGALKTAVQKSDRAIGELRTALDKTTASIEHERRERQTDVEDLRTKLNKLEQVQQELQKDIQARMEERQAQEKRIDDKLGGLAAQVNALRAANRRSESEPGSRPGKTGKAGASGAKKVCEPEAESPKPGAVAEQAPVSKADSLAPSPLTEKLKQQPSPDIMP